VKTILRTKNIERYSQEFAKFYNDIILFGIEYFCFQISDEKYENETG